MGEERVPQPGSWETPHWARKPACVGSYAHRRAHSSLCISPKPLFILAGNSRSRLTGREPDAQRESGEVHTEALTLTLCMLMRFPQWSRYCFRSLSWNTGLAQPSP